MIGQSLQLSLVNLRNLPARWAGSLVVVVSLAGVVGVMVSMLAMAQGMQKVFSNAGRPDRVVVLRNGATAEGGSYVTRDELAHLLDAPGLAHVAGGSEPLASLELLCVSALHKRGTTVEGGITVRGVDARAFEVRPEVKLVEGRRFQPGLREIVVGRSAQQTFTGLELGAQVKLSNALWTVVGVFESGGDLHESELWGDRETVLSGFDRRAYSAITAQLKDPGSFATYKDAITSDPTLNHTVMREDEYYLLQTEQIGNTLKVLVYTVAAIMAIGALFSAINTLYAAVRVRRIEIATLRALGFGATPIVLSVLLEGLALTLLGGLVGGGIAYLAFDGFRATSAAAGDFSFSQMAFRFQVSRDVLLQGLIWAATIGLLGALPPAVRAARAPIAEGLRNTG